MNQKSEYFILYNKLKRLIDEGTAAPGSKLPSERAMITQFGVSRTTVRRALDLLEKDNCIKKRPGYGCIVNTPSDENDQRTLRIGIDIESFSSSGYHREMIRSFQNASHPGCRIEYIVTGINDVLADKGNFDGIIMTHLQPAELERLECEYTGSTPLMFLNRTPARADFAYIAVNYTAVSRRLISRLLQNGAKRIAAVGSVESANAGYAQYTRMLGWEQAYIEHTGTIPQELMISNDVAAEMKLFTELLRSEKPEVVYVTTAGALPLTWAAVIQSGLVPGRDTNVICFDDIDEFGMNYHPVSYIRMRLDRMAARAVEYFAKHHSMQIPREYVQPQLVVEECKYLF